MPATDAQGSALDPGRWRGPNVSSTKFHRDQVPMTVVTDEAVVLRGMRVNPASRSRRHLELVGCENIFHPGAC